MKKVLLLAFGVACFAQTVIPHSVTLNWTCPANVSPPPPTICGTSSTGFQVQRGTVKGGPYSTIATVVGSQAFTYADVSATGNILTEGSTYYYVVETTGNGATLSSPSPEVAATIPFLVPTPPATVNAVVSSITAVWANEGGDKVTQDELRATNHTENLTGHVINSVWNGSRITLSGARNEVVSFNLVLEAGRAAASNVSVSFQGVAMTPLGTTTAITINSIPAVGNGVFNWVNRPIELFYLRYLQIQGLSFFGYPEGSSDERQIPLRLQRPWTGNGVATPGTMWANRPDHDKFYPDIMVPLELVPTFNVAQGTNQSIWADVYVSKTTPPGIYNGAVTVQENGVTTRSIPLVLTVYAFTLPDQPSAKTMVPFSEEDIMYRYSGGYGNYENPLSTQGIANIGIVDKYFELFHRHKITLIGENDCVPPGPDMPCASSMPRLNGSLFTAANGYDGPGIATPTDVFSIGTYGTWGWKSGGEPAMWTHADNWFNFCQTLPSMFCFLYLEDEPPASDYAQVNTWAQWIHDDPGPGHQLPSMATTYPLTAQESMPFLNIPTTIAGFGTCPAATGAPCTNSTLNQAAADFYRTTGGDKLWAYNGSDPAAGGSATEDDGVAMRQLGWAQYKKQIDRWFYWMATPLQPVDWFNTANTFGTISSNDPVLGQYGGSNGNGLLVYPGTSVYPGQTSYNVAGPFASLRLKEWRRGIQDADYLTLAAKINPAAVQSIVNGLIPQVLWEYNAPNIQWYTGGGISWSSDPDQWEAARAALAQIILSKP